MSLLLAGHGLVYVWILPRGGAEQEEQECWLNKSNLHAWTGAWSCGALDRVITRQGIAEVLSSSSLAQGLYLRSGMWVKFSSLPGLIVEYFDKHICSAEGEGQDQLFREMLR